MSIEAIASIWTALLGKHVKRAPYLIHKEYPKGVNTTIDEWLSFINLVFWKVSYDLLT